MTAVSMIVRPVRLDDAAAIAGLLGELGYPSQAAATDERLEVVLGFDDAGVLVVEADRQVVAVGAYQLIHALERRRDMCRLTSLVVRADHRRRGAARAVVAAIESIAREAGCFRLEVTTQVHREDAVGFYESIGFAERRYRLVKALD